MSVMINCLCLKVILRLEKKDDDGPGRDHHDTQTTDLKQNFKVK